MLSQFNSAVGARTCRGRCSQHCAPVPVLTNTPAGAALVLVLHCPLVDYSALDTRTAGVPTRSVQCREDGARGDPRQAAGCRTAPVPVAFSTFFTSLRMPNPEMTSITPRTISQMPTTSANVTMESNG